MSGCLPLGFPLAVLFLGILAALVCGLADGRSHGLRAVDRAVRPVHGLMDQLAMRLRRAAPAAVPAKASKPVTAASLAIQVLLDDRARRERIRRHVRAVLDGCVAAIGAPAGPCTIVVVRELEHEGKPIKGCVERLSFPDGASRTIIALTLREETGALALDEIAARLVRYYPAVTGAERTVVLADGVPGPSVPAVAPVSSPSPSGAPLLMPMPAGTRAGMAPAETLNGQAGGR